MTNREGLRLIAAFAAAALISPGASGADTLRVVSYNVYLGASLKKERAASEKNKPKHSIARMFRMGSRLRAPDILGLQEVCSDEGGWMLEYFRRMQEEQSGSSHMTFKPAHPDGANFMCDRGQAIYSTHPIVDSGVIQLPNVRQERSVTWADIEIPGHPVLRVYNAHLESSPKRPRGEKGRLLQTQVLLEHLLAWRAEHPDSPILLMGDLNSSGHYIDWWKPEAGIREIMKHLDSVTDRHVPTYIFTPYQLDWIFQSGFDVLQWQVVKYPLSDHYPVAADIELR